MTERETRDILAVLRAAYPSFYKGYNADALLNIVKLWTSMFRDDPAPEVAAAVKTLIATKEEGYPPTIGAVKSSLDALRRGHEMSGLEAWGFVSAAIRNGIYGYAKEFEKLPRPVQDAVGRPEQLREWAIMESGIVQSVVASNFQRSFSAMAQRRKSAALLPPEVRELAAGLAMGIERASPMITEEAKT